MRVRVTSGVQKLLKYFCLLTVLLWLNGCNWVWRTHLISTSPDNKSTVKVLWSRAPGSVQITVTTSSAEKILHSPDGDRVPALHEVAWSPDSQRVGVLVWI